MGRREHCDEGSDTDLVARFRAGDADAVREVYRRHSGAMYAIARWMLRDADQAADAVQQAFLQAWRAAATLDTSRPVGPWLAQITRRVAIDAHRRAGRRPVTGEPFDPEATAVDGEATIDQALTVAAVREAIDRLPARERTIARMAHVEGLTHQEIATQLGIPIGTVKSRGSRAQNRLAGLLCAHVAPDKTSRRACREEMSSLR